MIKLLYFARLREQLDCSEETIQLPAEIASVKQLHQLLCNRSETWSTALNQRGLFVAVNQTVVNMDTPLQGNEEVAFFPPMTGG